MSVAIRAEATEIGVHAYRRRFSAAYKLRILAEADACTEPGPLAPCCAAKACIRPTWRPNGPNGRQPQPALVREKARLRQELARVQDDLAQAREVVAIQGNVSALLQALAGQSAPNIWLCGE